MKGLQHHPEITWESLRPLNSEITCESLRPLKHSCARRGKADHLFLHTSLQDHTHSWAHAHSILQWPVLVICTNCLDGAFRDPPYGRFAVAIAHMHVPVHLAVMQPFKVWPYRLILWLANKACKP